MTRIVYQLEIKPSRLLQFYLVVIHSLAIWVTFFSGLASVYQLVIVLFCLLSFCYYAYCFFDIGSRCFTQRVQRDELGLLTIVKGDGNAEKALRLKSTVVGQYFTILYFQRSHSLLETAVFICADAVDHELYRQLRVYCRDPMTFQQ